MKNSLWNNHPAVIILLLSVLFVIIHISIIGEINILGWWTSDSAAYIETARNYSTTGNLVHSTHISMLNDMQPISLWPPGYPILLSLMHDIFDIDCQWVSLLIPVISWMIAPLIIFVFIRPLLGVAISAILSILFLSSPAALEWGRRAYTDMPFLLIVLLGFFLSCRLRSGWKENFQVFIGGVLLGISFSIKNVGAAALMAVFFSLVIVFFVKYDQKSKVLLKLIIWSAGSAMIVIPVILRNILTFGTIQPYSMSPSTVSFSENIWDYARAATKDLFGIYRYPKLIDWDFLVFVSAVTMIIGIGAYFFYRNREEIRKRAKSFLGEFRVLSPNIFVLITISIYSAIGIAIVIYGRTKYQWGVHINIRHVMQYDWAILTILFFLLLRLMGDYHGKVIVYALCVLMISGHFYYLSHNYYFKQPKFSEKTLLIYKTYKDDAIKKEVIRISKKGVVITSNLHDVLRIKTGVPIRTLYLKKNEKFVQSLKEHLLKFQKTLIDLHKEGRVFLFLKEDTLDKLMKENLSVVGIIVKRRNESLATIHVLPI
jgi:4-amino-4-deoxy-L-arabinose transferase-like glycosyltransferase